MKPLIMSAVAAAMLLTGTIAAPAQFTEEGGVALKASYTHHPSRNHRTRMTAQAERTSNPDLMDMEEYLRIPNVFRNCEEPLPRYCEEPGTLRRHR
jgi:hypothetical protein